MDRPDVVYRPPPPLLVLCDGHRNRSVVLKSFFLCSSRPKVWTYKVLFTWELGRRWSGWEATPVDPCLVGWRPGRPVLRAPVPGLEPASEPVRVRGPVPGPARVPAAAGSPS